MHMCWSTFGILLRGFICFVFVGVLGPQKAKWFCTNSLPDELGMSTYTSWWESQVIKAKRWWASHPIAGFLSWVSLHFFSLQPTGSILIVTIQSEILSVIGKLLNWFLLMWSCLQGHTLCQWKMYAVKGNRFQVLHWRSSLPLFWVQFRHLEHIFSNPTSLLVSHWTVHMNLWVLETSRVCYAIVETANSAFWFADITHQRNGWALCGYFLWAAGAATLADLFLKFVNAVSSYSLLLCFS
jgi:hypothetical protein